MMDGMPAPDGAARNRIIVFAAIAGIVVISWAYIVILARGMSGMGEMAPGMELVENRTWTAIDLVLLFLMWSVMMVGMMLPSAVPLILNFEAETRARGQNVLLRTTALVLGYVAVWIGFSAVATFGQWLLHSLALISPMMVSTSPALNGILLIAAGAYQLTPVQYNLLKRCRNPLQFIRLNWIDGTGGAFVQGLEHGAYCLGCCLVLMAILFVFGVMNLLMLALVTLFILAEKAFPYGHIAGIVSGPLMIAAGLYVLFIM
jgi:predicted metal-binding membrane protein